MSTAELISLSGGCGPNTAAGASGNRTRSVDRYIAPGSSAASVTTAEYCYDWADRLLSNPVWGAVPGASQIADGFNADEIAYDVRGNTTRLSDLLFSYDAENRHVGTRTYAGSTVSVVRDGSGRVVSRSVDPAGDSPAVTSRYVYAGAGDVPWAVVAGDAAPTVFLSLPGGVTVDVPSSGAASWSYPSLQGHTLTTGDGSTASGVQVYDPFGQPLDPDTLALGTGAANASGSVNGTSGWHQGAQKLTETLESALIVEMGARLYVPALGRFLQVDPVEGGVDNDYVWPTDPIGKNDLSGQWAFVALLVVPAVAELVLWEVLVAATAALILYASVSFATTAVLNSVRAEPVAVPRPGGKLHRPEKTYSLYQIAQQSTGNVWKYGITSQAGSKRPNSQLSACARYYGSSCQANTVVSGIRGYARARQAEYLRIRAYRVQFGRCPPGQRWSCK